MAGKRLEVSFSNSLSHVASVSVGVHFLPQRHGHAGALKLPHYLLCTHLDVTIVVLYSGNKQPQHK